ncbi:CBN-NDX-2 protein [Caenorhabditis brenneri]|uniref:CBN-NDX-2 protein n=1 Tax=Caenorhabditis brenneri TaxID=135651 RepID=G0NE17_CAEBE|nr:CBN-NDX-2 protein [Caenorhabditis brenneri]
MNPYHLAPSEVVFKGKWIESRKTDFTAKKNGAQGTWESTHRNKPPGVHIDGVSILARVKKDGKIYILLVKQYRIPVGKVCLELPAGLVDEKETIEQAALRELHEETGYKANRVVKVSTICYLDPSITDDSQKIVIVDVDGDSSENKNPVQKLDPTESIEIVLVEVSELNEYISNLDENVVVESTLLSFSMWNDFIGS